MSLYYKGNNNNEYKLRYGDEVNIEPLDENFNFKSLHRFGIRLSVVGTFTAASTVVSIEWLVDNFTTQKP